MMRTSTRIGSPAADPLELPLLQHAQQLAPASPARGRRSRRGRACRRRPARSGPCAGRQRAGERALLVAEQLALEQPPPGRAAQLTLMNGPGRARAVVVDRVGDQLLARAALAADQHRGVAARDLGDQVVDLLHRPGVADDVRGPEAVLQFLLQAQVLLEQPLALLLRRAAQAHRLGDHRGDDRQQPHVLGEDGGSASRAGRR